jgi:geranylgeranyl diphosphate synthase type I
MDLYAATWAYLATLPAVQEWPELRTLLEQVTQKQPRHWRLPARGCAASGGTLDQAIPAVAATGCLYLAIVLVDDMLDADPKGQHNTLGYPFTANLASALQAAGLEAIARAPVPLATQTAMLSRLNRMILLTALGQYWDAQNPHDEASYWRVTRTKSSPFFGTALAVGALLGGATEESAARLGEVGEIYGEMIQINDDLNDVMAVPANADWHQGRFPLPILFAELVPHPQQAQFRSLRQHITETGALQVAQEILIRSGAMSYAMDQLLQRHRQATDLLNQMLLVERAGVQQLLDEVVAPAQRLLDQVRVQDPG